MTPERIERLNTLEMWLRVGCDLTAGTAENPGELDELRELRIVKGEANEQTK